MSDARKMAGWELWFQQHLNAFLGDVPKVRVLRMMRLVDLIDQLETERRDQQGVRK